MWCVFDILKIISWNVKHFLLPERYVSRKCENIYENQSIINSLVEWGEGEQKKLKNNMKFIENSVTKSAINSRSDVYSHPCIG